MGSYDETKAALDAYKATVDLGTKAAADAYAKLQADYDAYKASHPDTPVPPKPPITPPAGSPFITVSGWKDFYKADFRACKTGDPLPTPWTAKTGTTNNAAEGRKENVQMVAGEGMVAVMSRDSVGGTVYTGTPRANLHIPYQRIARFGFCMEGYGPGSGTWPSIWGCGEGDIPGEFDDLEGFSAHYVADGSGATNPKTPRGCGGGLIATQAESAGYVLGTKTLDFDTFIPLADWGKDHVIETTKVKGSASWKIDGKSAGTIQTSAFTGGVAQFDDPKSVFDLRFDLQGPGGKSGDAGAGKITHSRVGVIARWKIRWVQILVPV